jgi:hypothetical protein
MTRGEATVTAVTVVSLVALGFLFYGVWAGWPW